MAPAPYKISLISPPDHHVGIAKVITPLGGDPGFCGCPCRTAGAGHVDAPAQRETLRQVPQSDIFGYMKSRSGEVMKALSVVGMALLLLTILGQRPAVAGPPVCPQPPEKIQRGQPNANAEAVNFSYRSQSYPVELYSAYAAQPKTIANYCLRYELENKAALPVQRLSWPLATMQLDALEPAARKSLIVTRGSDKLPWLDKTKIEAFLREEVSSRAFQVQTQKSREASVDTRLMREMQVPGQQWYNQVVGLKDSNQLPALSAQFSDGDTEINAVSVAKLDGSRISIQISISRSHDKSVTSISAPLALALSKGFVNQATVAAEFASSRALALPLQGNSFEVAFSFEKGTPIFVVEQPIVLTSRTGRVCFLAATYSPAAIEPRAQSCNLF